MAGPAPQPQPNTPTWTGPLRVTDRGINMSYQPPAGDTIGGTATVQYDAGTQTLAIENQGPAAVWIAPTDPSYDQCAQLVQTQPLAESEMSRIPYRQGHGLCVVTFGNTAMAFVRSSGAPGPDAVQMHGLRWPFID